MAQSSALPGSSEFGSREHPHRSVIGRLVRSLGALGFAQLFNIASNLLLVPLFLSAWRAEQYGEWVALSALVAYVGATDFGMNSAASNALLSAYAKRDMAKYRSLQASALGFYIVVASAITVAIAILCISFPVARWMGISHIDKVTAACVIWLLASRLMWAMPASQIGNIFRSIGNLALAQWFGNANAMLLTAVTVLVLVLHGGVLALAAWSWLPLVVCTGLAWMVVSAHHAELLPRLSEANMTDARSLLRPSIWFGVMMVAMAIGLNGPPLLVARVFGGVAVALLVTTRTLVNIAQQFIGILCNAIWPELTHFDSVGNYTALRSANRLLTAVCMFGAISLAGTLWFQGGDILGIWTRHRLIADPWLLRGFLLYIVGRAPWLAGSMMGMATNQNKQLASFWLASAVIGVGCAACLMPWLHLVAIPCGLLLGEAIMCYHFVVRHACKMIHEDYARLTFQTWSTLMLACIASLLAGWFVERLGIRFTALRWVLSGAFTTLITGLCVGGLFLQRVERNMLLNHLRRGVGLGEAASPITVETAQ